jgi:hypothetical protein
VDLLVWLAAIPGCVDLHPVLHQPVGRSRPTLDAVPHGSNPTLATKRRTLLSGSASASDGTGAGIHKPTPPPRRGHDETWMQEDRFGHCQATGRMPVERTTSSASSATPRPTTGGASSRSPGSPTSPRCRGASSTSRRGWRAAPSGPEARTAAGNSGPGTRPELGARARTGSHRELRNLLEPPARDRFTSGR